MRAAILKEFGEPLVVEDIPVPDILPNEVLVKVKASGLCMTDVHIQQGIILTVTLPYIPGHEMAGVVVRVGDKVRNVTVGQHVVCGIDITCGGCPLCLKKRENLCLKRVRIGFERDGSHAEYAAVPADNLYPIDEKVPFEQACVIPDAVACMLHAIEDIGRVQPKERVLIHGVGGLGLQGVQILRHIGAEIFAAARTGRKLDMALELGADHIINTREQNLVDEIDRLTEGEMCDIVLDLVGQQDTVGEMLKCIRPGGRIVALAYAAPKFSGDYQEMVIKEKEILGLRGSTRKNMLDTIRMVEQGVLKPTVTGRYPLEEINQALEDLRESKGLGRNVIVFE